MGRGWECDPHQRGTVPGDLHVPGQRERPDGQQDHYRRVRNGGWGVGGVGVYVARGYVAGGYVGGGGRDGRAKYLLYYGRIVAILYQTAAC